MKNPIIQNGIKPIDSIASIILFGMLSFGSVHLYEIKELSEVTLVALLSASGIFAFILLFNRRLKKASATGLELYAEIEKKEESINQVASDIVKFILISTKGMVVYNGSSDKDIVASAKKVLESAGVKDADAFIAKHKKD